MGTYNIPRNVKGEGRILFIFSTKALIYTAVGGGIGILFYFLLSALNMKIVGIVIVAVLSLLGFVVGTFKFPEFAGLKFTRKIGGESIDDVVKRAFKFRNKGRKIYIYTKEEQKNG